MTVSIKREKVTIARSTTAIQRTAAKIPKADEPVLQTMFEEEDGVVVIPEIETGDVAADIDANVSAELMQVIEARKSREEHFRIANDTRYYFVLCFQSTDQKEEFIRKMGWEDLGLDFLNGLEVARRLGVEIKYVPLEPIKLRGNAKRYTGMTLKSS